MNQLSHYSTATRLNIAPLFTVEYNSGKIFPSECLKHENAYRIYLNLENLIHWAGSEALGPA